MSDHPLRNPFSIKLRIRIVHLGAGNEPNCRRIEAPAQEKLGAAGALRGIRGGGAPEAPAQLRGGRSLPVAIGRIDRGTDQGGGQSMGLELERDPVWSISLTRPRSGEARREPLVALVTPILELIDRLSNFAVGMAAHGQLGLELARGMLAAREEADAFAVSIAGGRILAGLTHATSRRYQQTNGMRPLNRATTNPPTAPMQRPSTISSV